MNRALAAVLAVGSLLAAACGKGGGSQGGQEPTGIACADYASPNNGVYRTDSRVSGITRDFFEAFTGRRLSSDEVRQAAHEVLGDRETMTPEDFEAELKSLADGAKRLRDEGPKNGSLYFRHSVIQNAYFAEGMQHTLCRCLALEPDPVRVADARVSRVMTQRDLGAFLNISNFSVSSTEPHHREITPAQLDIVAQELDRSFGARPTSSAEMPQFYSDSAAFWAGIRREWPGLTPAERSALRDYTSFTIEVDLSQELYQKVWGTTWTEAGWRRLDDTLARMWEVTLLSTQMTNYMSFMGSVSATFANFWLELGAW